MRRLILVRHAAPAIDPLAPAATWHLREDGVTATRLLAGRLNPGSAPRVYSSAEPKAHETAAVLGETWSLPVVIARDLHEHERPDAALLTRAAFEERVRALFLRPSEVVLGAESADQARRRFTAALMRAIAASSSSSDVVVVTHGTVLTLFVAEVTGTEPYSFWRRLTMPCAITLSLPDFALLEIVGVDAADISATR